LREILRDALKGGYAVGYFEPWDQYSMEAVIRAAENKNSPVIIGCGGIMMDQNWFNSGGMEALAEVGRVLAHRSKVPTALLLNEVSTFEQVEHGIAFGFNAVMFDSSHLPFEENVRIIQKVVAAAHPADVDVEAELGHLPLGSGENDKSKSFPTDPDEAAEFVERTKVDALAVSIGNVHVHLKGKYAMLDFDRLEKIHRRVKLPLVIHGSTGFPDEAIPGAIKLGVAKFNVGTLLKRTFWHGLQEALKTTPENANPHHVVGSRKDTDVFVYARERLRREVERLITLYMGFKENQ
jgi:ketose-bisphosphate aldolase